MLVNQFRMCKKGHHTGPFGCERHLGFNVALVEHFGIIYILIQVFVNVCFLGMGFTNDPFVSRAFRDFRVISIGGGSDETMLSIICKYMGTLPAMGKKK